MNKIFVYVCVALAVFFGTCYGASTTVAFMADFTMRNANKFPNGFVTGKVYYYYDVNTPMNSRVRFETSYGGSSVHTELYHYQNNALYSICDTCTATLIGADPERWEKTNTDQCSTEGDYFRCYRSGGSPYSVAEFVSKGTGTSNTGYDVKYVKFADGREYTFTNLQKITYNNYKTKFELSDSDECPQPVCHSFVDVVFVLDASGSVDDNEWRSQKNFLTKAVEKFNVGPNDAYIGIVEFCAPYECCKTHLNGCTKYTNEYSRNPTWQDITCDDPSLGIRKRYNPERYIDDCAFDLKCKNYTEKTAKIFLNLTYSRVKDTITSLPRLYGNTCQRYGLQKAYDMLYNRNPRCPIGTNKSECPTPVVIVVTDGADYCHETTQIWADKIKAEDERALLLEVGVGLETNYDREFLKNLSSKLTGFDSSLNVDNYAQIDTVLAKIMEPACSLAQTSGGSCGSSCKGYCACSECFCPQCSEDAPNCNEYVCSDVAASLGCREQETVCHSGQVEDKLCFNEFCSPEDGECKIEPVDCAGPYEEAHSRTLKQCESIPCSNGCASEPVLDHEFCNNLVGTNCSFGRCSPLESTDESGCVTIPKSCNVADFPGCHDAQCDNSVGCYGITCDTACYWNRDGLMVPKCPKKDCIDVTCNEDATSEDERCIETPHVCEQPNNKCQKSVCYVENGENLCKIVEDKTILNCSGKNKKDGCRTWRCDADADNEDGSKGACVFELEDHKQDNCIDYECGDDDLWHAIPRCTSDKKCKISRCNDADGSCFEVDVDCRGKVRLPNKCFEAACKEPDGCYKKQYRGAYFDVCGRCISANEGDSAISYSDEESTEDCVVTSEEDLPTEGLAAAAVALIVVGVIILGAAIALSSVVGTKALIDRARGASDQAVVSNPLFEDSQTEMTNPAFMGEA